MYFNIGKLIKMQIIMIWRFAVHTFKNHLFFKPYINEISCYPKALVPVCHYTDLKRILLKTGFLQKQFEQC